MLNALMKVQSMVLDIHENNFPTLFSLVANCEGGDTKSKQGKKNRFKDFAIWAKQVYEAEDKVEEILKRNGGKELQMHLICERCYEPTEPTQASGTGEWPVSIVRKPGNSKLVKCLVIISHLTLKAAALIKPASALVNLGFLYQI